MSVKKGCAVLAFLVALPIITFALGLSQLGFAFMGYAVGIVTAAYAASR